MCPTGQTRPACKRTLGSLGHSRGRAPCRRYWAERSGSGVFHVPSARGQPM